jgi:polar amino acid transport system substrate-binding protein
VGISPGDLPHIMDPFFTTKRNNGGTGLGLSVALAIISEHGGSLDFTSTPGKGTIATVALPVEDEKQSGGAVDQWIDGADDR